MMASSLAYYLALSLLPMLLVLVAGLGIFMQQTGWGQSARQQVLQTLALQTSPEVAQQVETLMEQVETDSAASGRLGMLLLLFASLAVFAQLDRSFNKIWKRQEESTGGIWKSIKRTLFGRLHAFVMLLGVVGLLVVVLLSGMIIQALQEWTVGVLPSAQWIWSAAPIALTLVINFVLFTTLYRVMPQSDVAWRLAARGGTLVSIAWEIGRQLLLALVIGEKYTAFGVVGSFLVVLLWGYYASMLILLGAEYVKVVSEESVES